MLFARSEGREFKRRPKRKLPISAHPFFVPAIAVWGAALCGLAIFVLPSATIQSVASTLGLGGLGGFARVILAVLAGLLGFAVSRIIAKKLQATRNGNSGRASVAAADDVDAIDPAEELGSESLDAPIGDDIEEDSQEDVTQDINEDSALDNDAFESDAFDAPSSEDNVLEDKASTQAAFEEGALDEDDVLELGVEDFAEEEFPEDKLAADELTADEDTEWIGDDQPPQNDAFEIDRDTEERITLGEEFGEQLEAPLAAKPSPLAKLGFPFSRRAKQEEPQEGKQVELVRALKGHLARQTQKVEADEAGELSKSAEANAGDSEAAETSTTGSPAAPTSSAPPRPTASAVDRLREVPPHELSLVQLVERFAAALHDHQEAAHARAAAGATNGREVALAEALKTLALFTQDGLRANLDAEIAAETAAQDAETQVKPEIRDAVAKLQKLRGAA